MADTTVQALRESLCSEATPLPVRFRALFSLKHVATTGEPDTAVAAIEAIAAAFASPSALLKHELAYCLGQTGNDAAVQPLRDVLSDLKEDPMCRHEAAEALGALGHAESLELLKYFRDREGEEVVITETCEIAIDRIEWENSEKRKQEKLRQRLVTTIHDVWYIGFCHSINSNLVILPRLTQRHLCPNPKNQSTIWANSSWILHSLCLCDTAPCLPCATWLHRPTAQLLSLLCLLWPRDSLILLLSSVTKLPSSLASCRIPLRSLPLRLP